MKIRIVRVSPHQNAKVFGILMGSMTLIAAIPMFFVMLSIPTGVDRNGNPMAPPPAWLALLLPVVYLIMGYLMAIIGCWLYNLVARFVGGVEYETRE